MDQVRKEIEMENRTHTDVINFLHKKRKYLGEKGWSHEIQYKALSITPNPNPSFSRVLDGKV